MVGTIGMALLLIGWFTALRLGYENQTRIFEDLKARDEAWHRARARREADGDPRADQNPDNLGKN